MDTGNPDVTITPKRDGNFLMLRYGMILEVPRSLLLAQFPKWAEAHDATFGAGSWGTTTAKEKS
jgi:hypothetical protein